MGRQIYLPVNASEYLETLASVKRCVLGLVLGEISSSKDDIINVVHLARTPEDKIEASSSESVDNGQESKLNLKTISESWVADHAKHVTRMLPGGMFVLGVFVVSPEDIFSDSTISNKLKYIILYINKILSVNKYMHGYPEHSADRVVIHMSSETKKITARSIEIGEASFFKPINLCNPKYSPTWIEFECYYEFDEFYPVVVKNTGISVKEQCQIILSSAYKSIQSSVVIFDGNLRVSSDTLESQFKKKKNSSQKSSNEEDTSAIQVSIMVPCESNLPESVEYMECEGTTHFSGIIASRVFLISKSTIEEAIQAVKQDIMRSLAARFTMHCDALIDDNLLPEEKVCFNEPPRRVYIKIPQVGGGKVLLCDYLFPGESPVEALVSVKEMLDADITEDDVISNVETPADTSEFDALEKDPSSEEMLTTPQDVNKITFPMGVGISVLVALIAVLIYYYLTISHVKSS